MECNICHCSTWTIVSINNEYISRVWKGMEYKEAGQQGSLTLSCAKCNHEHIIDLYFPLQPKYKKETTIRPQKDLEYFFEKYQKEPTEKHFKQLSTLLEADFKVNQIKREDENEQHSKYR